MARQKSPFKFQGSIGDITFYKSKDGHLVREKGGVSGERIKNDPKFQRVRENNAEFARGGKAAKLILNAFRSVSLHASDSKVISRLVKTSVEILKTDSTHDRGQRLVQGGELELFEGFDFNVSGILGTTLHASFTANVARDTGQLTINFPSFIPINSVSAPPGATHFKIVSAAAELDFEKNVFVRDQHETVDMLWDANPTPVINLQNQLPVNSAFPLFLVLGISFSQIVNGKVYTLKDGTFNALNLLKVSLSQ